MFINQFKTSNPMRNIFLLYCVALAGLCACESEEKVYPDGPGLNEVGMQIVLTDPELNDLLNPESPSFLGEEYTKGILVMYLNAGKKTLCQFVPQYTNEGGTQKEWNMIYPPYEDYERDGRVKKNTKGYYYLPFPFNKTEENQDVSYIYVQYPNGSEDEIKKLLLSNVRNDRSNDDDFDYGTEELEHIESDCPGMFRAYSVFSGYHIDYVAQEFATIDFVNHISNV